MKFEITKSEEATQFSRGTYDRGSGSETNNQSITARLERKIHPVKFGRIRKKPMKTVFLSETYELNWNGIHTWVYMYVCMYVSTNSRDGEARRMWKKEEAKYE